MTVIVKATWQVAAPNIFQHRVQRREATAENAMEINRDKGIPAIPAQVKTASQGAEQGRIVSKKVTIGIQEQSRGKKINTVA